MKKPDQAWWEKARRARDQLVAQVISHPGVRMVDIGIDPKGKSNTPLLRVHVRQQYMNKIKLPSHIEGIPVRVIRGDYDLEQTNSE